MNCIKSRFGQERLHFLGITVHALDDILVIGTFEVKVVYTIYLRGSSHYGLRLILAHVIPIK